MSVINHYREGDWEIETGSALSCHTPEGPGCYNYLTIRYKDHELKVGDFWLDGTPEHDNVLVTFARLCKQFLDDDGDWLLKGHPDSDGKPFDNVEVSAGRVKKKRKKP